MTTKTKFQTMILKFIKDDYDEHFERDSNKEIAELCQTYNMELTNLTFYERIHCLTATLKTKRKVELVIKE